MKKTTSLFLLLAFFALSTSAQTQNTKAATLQKPATEKVAIKWMTIEEAEKMMKIEPKNLMIDVYTEWCGPCKMMMKSTFKDPKVIKYVNENFYAVKFNGQGPKTVTFNGKEYKNPNFNAQIGTRTRNSQHQLTSALGVRAYPTIIFMNPKYELVHKGVGYKDGTKFMPELKKGAVKPE